MIRRSLALISVALLAALTALGAAQQPPPAATQPKPVASPEVAKKEASPKVAYEDLLARVRKSDPLVDFKQLRLAYTETKSYSPYGGNIEARKAMFSAHKARQFEKALEQADKILADNFVEINAHYVAHISHRELGHTDKATFHKYVFDGLIKSITGSGDGLSTETAFVVISTDEEYVLLNFLGLRPSKQALVNKEGHAFDAMTAVDPKTNQSVTYYFNIDKPFFSLGKSLTKQ
jgi:hypothetical protein